MKSLNKEESYSERRLLFKKVWNTAVDTIEKEGVTKQKIIRTLHLDEDHRNLITKKKIQRIKHIKAVCNKILNYCDRQNAEDLFHKQKIIAEDKELPEHKPKPKKCKARSRKRSKKVENNQSPKFGCNTMITINDQEDVISNQENTENLNVMVNVPSRLGYTPNYGSGYKSG